MIKYYTDSKQIDKLGDKLFAFAKLAIGTMNTTKNKEEYEIGVLTAIVSEAKSYIKGNIKQDFLQTINKAINIQRDNIDKFREEDKDFTKILSTQLKELFECKNLL